MYTIRLQSHRLKALVGLQHMYFQGKNQWRCLKDTFLKAIHNFCQQKNPILPQCFSMFTVHAHTCYVHSLECRCQVAVVTFPTMIGHKMTEEANLCHFHPTVSRKQVNLLSLIMFSCQSVFLLHTYIHTGLVVKLHIMLMREAVHAETCRIANTCVTLPQCFLDPHTSLKQKLLPSTVPALVVEQTLTCLPLQNTCQLY